jgi:gliding motility-associated-like protein
MKRIFTKNYLFLFILFFAVLKINAQSVGGSVTGATTVCPNSPNSGFLGLTGYTGNSFYWQASTDGGITWNNTGTTITSQSYVNLTQTTCYRVIVQDGVFPPDTSTVACITIIAPSVGGTISGGGEFCITAAADTLHLTGNTGNVLYWQYSINGGATWITVANPTTTLIHPNITQNTIYRVVVQNGATCPKDSSAQASFVIDPVTVAGTISGSDTVCYGVNNDSLILSGNIGNVIYWLSSTDGGSTWNTLSNTSLVQNYNGLTQTTWYAAAVQSGVCNMDTTAPAVIAVWMPTPVSAGADATIIKGQSVTLNGAGIGKPFWSPSAGLNNDTLLQPTATPGVTTNYVLTVTDIHGCINTDTVMITVKLGEFSGMISNLFTPNGDGINDTWYVRDIQNFPDNEVCIYNIYGNEVYRKKSYANDWKGTYNGSELPDGTYYYVLKFDGSSEVFKGSLDILRSK